MKITEDQSITIGNICIGYTDDLNDSDLPVIFIHGFPLDKSMWSSQRDALRNKFRVITYDIRGYGTSEAGTEPFSMDQYAEDLLQLMNALELDKVVLCGLSMGGYIALKAMEKFSERIVGLILCDTQCAADTTEAKKNRFKTIDMIQSNGLELYADQALSSLFYSETMDKKSKEIIEIRNVIEGCQPDIICETLMALANRDETCSVLSTINIPTLILVGEEDTVTPIAKSEYIHSKISGSTLYTIGKAGHLSNIDNPEVFNRHIYGFLKGVMKQRSHLPSPH